jgi:hypothetical protein
MPGEVAQVTLLVAQTLERIGVPYAVVGSLASSLHGVMRSTLDVDMVANMKLDHVRPLVDALAKEFYADETMIREAVERRGSFNLIHYETAFKVDIFLSKLRPFDLAQMERRKIAAITADPEQTIYVISPEDIILAKFEWYRLGGEVSNRQWRDILGVIKTCADELDLAYLRQWAADLQVSDLLERAYQEAI